MIRTICHSGTEANCLWRCMIWDLMSTGLQQIVNIVLTDWIWLTQSTGVMELYLYFAAVVANRSPSFSDIRRLAYQIKAMHI
jgi:predicted NAD/FAD-binding protein